MSQSLLDRFRGCLLGILIVNSIVKETTILEDWEKINQKIIIDLIQTEIISRETCQGIFYKDEPILSGQFMIKILPLILFFHETESLLYEQLEKIEKNSNINPKIIDEVMLFREILSVTLKPQKNKEHLNTIFTLAPFLEEIQTFLNHQTPLTKIKRQFRQKTDLDSNYLLLSLYCFARTPNNFRLSILQATQFNHPVILGITTALSGSYNGYSNLPISWRLSMKQDKKYESCYQQTTQLWAKWVGIEDPFKTIRPLETQVIHSLRSHNP